MESIKVLKNLGLEEKEAEIYIASLELGESSVARLAIQSGIKRPTTYIILESLIEKSLVSKVIKGKKIYYTPLHPKKLQVEAINNLEQINSVLPHFESLYNAQTNQPRIRMFEGLGKLDAAYDEFFSTKGEVLYIGNFSAAAKVFEQSYIKLANLKYSKDFSIKMIIDNSRASREYALANESEFHQTKFIPSDLMPFNVDIGIFDNKTIITSVTENYFSVSIEASEITQAFKTVFEIMWRQVNK